MCWTYRHRGPTFASGHAEAEMRSADMTRRSVLKGGAALAGALALGDRLGGAAGAPEARPALVVLWLNGGPAGLFNSAGSFLGRGSFGVAENNVRGLGHGLV